MPSVPSVKPAAPEFARESGRLVATDAEDFYFSADVETDGPIPGPYSMLSFALVCAGRYDGRRFTRPADEIEALYVELKPISAAFEPEAMRVHGLDRERLCREGEDPVRAMSDAAAWVRDRAGSAVPILVAYPLSFDWSWLYWYFIRFSETGSPFNHSRCYDLKTAFAVKSGAPVAVAGRDHLPAALRSHHGHMHHALQDAIEQAEIFSKIFTWGLDSDRIGKGSR